MFAASLLISLASPLLLTGQTPTAASPSPAVTAEQRAGDDAFQQFVDQVLALRLADGRASVATLLATNDLIRGQLAPGAPERELRRLLSEQLHFGAARPLAGGGVEVDVWLPTPTLAEILQTLAARLSGVDRARIALPADIGPAVTATVRYVPDGEPRDDRPGWRQCTPEQMAQVQAAAEIDLRQRLMAMLADLRTPAGGTLHELLSGRPRLREALQARVRALKPGVPVFEPTGLCRVIASVTRKEAAAWLREAGAESKEAPAGLESLADGLPAQPTIVEGLSVPPPTSAPRVRATAAASRPAAAVDRPVWVERFIRVQATGRPPPGETDPARRRDLAARAARLEAERTLWMEIEKLPLADGTVGDRLAGHPRMREAAEAIDALIIPVSNPVYADDGSATVILGIRMESVWEVLRELR